jgi:hypothetical protein
MLRFIFNFSREGAKGYLEISIMTEKNKRHCEGNFRSNLLINWVLQIALTLKEQGFRNDELVICHC